MDEILKIFPETLKNQIERIGLKEIEEIRLRTGKPVIIKSKEEKILDYIISQELIQQILQRICDNSIYSYQNQICEGYITIKGGHRIRNCWKCRYKR